MKPLYISLILASLAIHFARAQFQAPITIESPNAQTEGHFGAEGVAWVPDVTGDGIPDLIVPALSEFGSSGRVYVFDGVSHQLVTEIAPPAGVVGAEFGGKVAGIGDLNGNGTGEVIAATYGSHNRVYVFDGATGDSLYAGISRRARSLSAVPDATGDGIPDILVGAASSAVLYSGATGLQHRWLSAPAGGTSFFGWSVAGVADVNGDGMGDAVVGDWMGQRVHVFNGSSGRLLHTLSAPGGSGSGAFGRSVAGLRDANGDGRGDIAVGASDSSVAYLYDGAHGDVISTLRPPPADNAQQFGWVVEEVPDITGDGLSDVAVLGSPSAEPLLRTVYIFDGSASSPEPLVGLSGARDFGGGDSIAGTPDLNGDGLSEVLMANWRATSSRRHTNAGHVLLFLSESPETETEPIVSVAGDTVIVSWQPGVYDRLQVSPDHESWEDIPDLDARSTGSFSELLSVRGRISFYRLARD